MFLIDKVTTKKCRNHDQCCDGKHDQSLGTVLHKAQEDQGKEHLMRPVWHDMVGNHHPVEKYVPNRIIFPSQED